MSDSKRTDLNCLNILESLPQELKEHIIKACLFDHFEQNLRLIRDIQLVSHIFYNVINNLMKQKRFVQKLIGQTSKNIEERVTNARFISSLAKLGTIGAIDCIQDELRKDKTSCNNLLYELCSKEEIDRLSFKMLTSILKAGIDVNDREDFHDYPLIEAINKNNFQIVKTLLKFNANPYVKDIFSENIFFLCILTVNPKIIMIISFAQIYTLLKKVINYGTK